MKIVYEWKCKYCDFIGVSRRKLQIHHKEFHGFVGHSFPAWNKNKPISEETKLKISKALTGKPSHLQSEESRLKISNTAKVNKKSGGYRKGSGCGKKGWYKGYFCDSSWELAFVIYNLEHGIEFERNHTFFNYEYEGQIKKYLPDWKMNDEYIGNKGYWSEQWEAKLKQFPKDKNLIVISEKEIQPYLKYVIDKYGKNFISLYE